MAHCVKGLLHKHEEQNLMPQTHIETLGVGHPLVNPVLKRQALVSPKTVRVPKEQCSVLTCGLHKHTHVPLPIQTCTCVHIYAQL